MLILRSCFCGLVVACYLAAQQPTIALQALTPPTATVTSGAQTWSNSMPAGPLPATGRVAVGLPTPRSAYIDWMSTSTIHGAELQLTMFVGDGPVGSVGELGQGELLVTFLANAPAPWRLEGGLGPATSITGLLFWIDLGNDGTIDWTPTTYGAIGAFGDDLSAQPLVMRIIYQGVTSLTTAASGRLDLRVVPGDASALRLPTNCYNPNLYEVDPLFSPNADFQLTTSYGAYTTWQVLGFSLQPTTLPITLTGTPVPCTLMPSADYVLRTPTMFLQVPATLRPLTIYAQSLYLFAGDLRPSDTFVMTAN